MNALYWWAPLMHPFDRAPSLADADVAERVRLFADAYQMDQPQRAQVVPIALQRSHNAHAVMRAAAQADPVFKRWWDDGVKDRMPRTEAWLQAQRDRIQSILLATS